jgi:ribosome-associated protein
LPESAPAPADNGVTPPTGPAPKGLAQAEALHDLVLQSLDDDQAVEVVSIPLTGKSSIADFMVIASGRSSRQVASMAQKLTERIKKELGRNVRLEGLPWPTGS